MRFKLMALVVGFALTLSISALAQTRPVNPSEQELIDKYLKQKAQKTKDKNEKSKKLYWVSGHYSLNRINRDNDYNKFVNYESNLLSNTDLNWLNTGSELGLDFGWLAGKNISWTIGGELWMPLGETQTGSFSYNPPSGSTTVTELKSEIKVYGVTTGLQYYVMNPPNANQKMIKPAIKVGVGAGYYQAKWNLWDEYANLNLATSSPDPTNSTFRDNTIGFTLNLGGEYPISTSGFALGLDLHYLYLNFKDVAWYNSSDQKVVATYEGSSSSAVVLGLSGVRGKLELKKFFSW